MCSFNINIKIAATFVATQKEKKKKRKRDSERKKEGVEKVRANEVPCIKSIITNNVPISTSNLLGPLLRTYKMGDFFF